MSSFDVAPPLDITDEDRVATVALRCGDVSLLVNNAGVMRASATCVYPEVQSFWDELTRPAS